VKPYYEHDGITIFHGDCRDVLPTLGSVDLVLTDPPYGVNLGYRQHRTASGGYQSVNDSPEYVRGVVVPIINLCRGISKRLIVTPGDRCLWDYPRPDVIGTIWIPAGVGMSKWGFICSQPILYYGDDPTNKDGGRPNSFAGKGRRERTLHPCAKPIEWLRWMVKRGSTENETVLDPFMGSGTTLRAAKDLGRKAIGIEIEERYCEIAAKRLAQGVLALEDSQ